MKAGNRGVCPMTCTRSACGSAQRRGCCSHARLLLDLWPTFPIVPCVLALRQPRRLILPFSCGPGPAAEGLKAEPVPSLPSVLTCQRGNILRGRPFTQAATVQTRVFNWLCFPEPSHFPPLFSYLQDAGRLRTGRRWKGSRVWWRPHICYIIKAGISDSMLNTQLHLFDSRCKKFKIWGFFFQMEVQWAK